MLLADLLVRSLTEIWWIHPSNGSSILLLKKGPCLVFNYYSVLILGEIFSLLNWILTFKRILNVNWSSSVVLAISLRNMNWLLISIRLVKKGVILLNINFWRRNASCWLHWLFSALHHKILVNVEWRFFIFQVVSALRALPSLCIHRLWISTIDFTLLC